MADAALIFTRTLLGLGDLTVIDDTSADYVLETLSRPGRTPVNTMASSGLTHGEVITRTRLEQATIPFSCLVQGTTTDQVETRIDALERCMSQLYFEVTHDVDGYGRGYDVYASTVSQPDGILHGWVDNYIARLSVVLSVYPLAAT